MQRQSMMGMGGYPCPRSQPGATHYATKAETYSTLHRQQITTPDGETRTEYDSPLAQALSKPEEPVKKSTTGAIVGYAFLFLFISISLWALLAINIPPLYANTGDLKYVFNGVFLLLLIGCFVGSFVLAARITAPRQREYDREHQVAKDRYDEAMLRYGNLYICEHHGTQKYLFLDRGDAQRTLDTWRPADQYSAGELLYREL